VQHTTCHLKFFHSCVYSFYKALVTHNIFLQIFWYHFSMTYFSDVSHTKTFVFNVIHFSYTLSNCRLQINTNEYLYNIPALIKQLYRLAALHKPVSCFPTSRDTIYRYSVFKKPVICACPVSSLLLNSLPAEPLGSMLLMPPPLDTILSQFHPPPILTTYLPMIHLTN